MKHSLFLFILSFFAFSLSAQSRFLEHVFNQVTVSPSIIYGRNETVLTLSITGHPTPQPLVFKFYEPTGDTSSARPLVLVLPGGLYLPPNTNGWCDGSINDSSVVEICTRLAKMGYVAAAVDYREGWNPLSPQQEIRLASFSGAVYRGIQDVRTAVRYFKKTAVLDGNPFRIDTSRIVVWGESTGGQIALGAAYAKSPADWTDPVLTVPPGIPMILPAADGDIWGTSTGIVPPGYPFGLPAGDTLCLPNWPGYSSDFQLCVSMAGDILDLPWISAGEVPAILFHAPNDGLFPCGDGVFAVAPPTNLPVAAVSGSCSIVAQLEATGNNQVFLDANINDCLTDNALTINGGLEGFYPFTGLSNDLSRPWQWNGPCANNPSAPTDGAYARQYLDTVFAYFAPRACAALALCNAQANPNGLCGTQVKGQLFVDVNQNGLLDNGESPVKGAVVEMQPGGYHALSGLTGKYYLSAPPGDYTLDVPNPPTYYASTNTPATITVPVGADVVQDVRFQPSTTVNDLQVFLTAASDPKPGFSNILYVHWKNVGTTQLSGTVTLTFDANYYVSGSTPPANISGNVATWTFENLPPLQSGSAWLQTGLPSLTPLGTILNSSVAIEGTGVTDFNPTDNVAYLQETVVGSFDPNDKRVVPAGQVSELNWPDYHDWLNYTVRFQNTGTAPAANVHIIDTLSDLLNINTLEIVGASHPVRWQLEGQHTLTFYFDDIQLADSFHNEAASHGFVRYRVRPRLSFEELNANQKPIENFADIYFDFNTPVRTDTAETIFVITVATQTPGALPLISVVPNPAGDFATFSWSGLKNEKAATLRILNATGQAVFFREIPAGSSVSEEKVGLKNWVKGLYFVQFTTESGMVSRRFIKG